MHIRFVTNRRGDKVFRYPQLVESFRRPDGMPAHRVLAGLSKLSELELDNLRKALAASREGRPLGPSSGAPVLPTIRKNLAYLDVATVLALWNDLGLPELLRTTLKGSAATVSDADVLAALAVHRCVAAGSKLAANRWYPNTALPLLQGLERGAFNNSRVHRALSALSDAEPSIQAALPERLRPDGEGFVALFLDATDTWFEGRGAPMAEKGLDKEGVYRRRIGLALLCDPRGFPIRWKTLPGRYRDTPVMEELCGDLAKEAWVATAPVVMDRAMGRAGSVEFLAESGLRFLTALALDEFAQYSTRIPEVDVGGEATETSLAAWARAAGFTLVRPDRYVLDLGVIDKGEGDAWKGRRHRGPEPVSMTCGAMARAQALGAELAAGSSRKDIAQRQDSTVALVDQDLRLLKLNPPLQARVMAGEVRFAKLQDLLRVVRLPAAAQLEAFEALCASGVGKTPRAAHARHQPKGPPPIRVRLVVHFNPERFLEQRRVEEEKVAEVRALVATLNDHLAQPHARRSARAVQREVELLLTRKKLMEVATLRLDLHDDGRARAVHLTVDEEKRLLRRRHDGINAMVASPKLTQTAAELVELYFAKDAVERDFHTIKSEVELRPVRHRTDPKVRAHVALCVLALLVERAMEDRLRRGGLTTSAPAALEELRTCHLNEVTLGPTSAHQLTEPTKAQHAILAALGTTHLLTPRTRGAAMGP